MRWWPLGRGAPTGASEQEGGDESPAASEDPATLATATTTPGRVEEANSPAASASVTEAETNAPTATETQPEGKPQPSGGGARTPSISLRGWVGLAIVLGFLGGGPGLLLAAAFGVAAVVLSPRPRTLLRWSIAALALVPLVVLAKGLPPAFFVSPDFVRKDLAAHYLAGIALALLVLGILRDTREPVAEPAVTSPAAPPKPKEDHALAPEPTGPPRISILRRPLPRPRIRIPRLHPPRLPVPWSGFWLALLTVAAIDIILRYAVGGSASPDPVTARIGTNLAAGSGFSLPGPLGGLAPTALRAPMVPALYAVTQTSVAPAFLLRLLWAMSGGGTVVATGLAGRRLFSPGTGLAAAVLVSLLPTFWLENVRLESAPIAQLLVALLLLVLAGSVQGSGESLALGARRGILVGVLGGLLALTRPEGIVLGGTLIIGWLLRRGDAASPRRRLMVAGFVAVALAATAGPWFARNWSQFRTVLPVTETGEIAVGANAPSAYTGGFVGSFDPAAGQRAIKAAETKPLGEGALNRTLYKQAGTYAIHHPGGLLVALGVRALRTFELWSPANERAAHAARGLATRGWKLQWLSFLVLFALAVIGYVRLWPARTSEAAPLFLAPVAALFVGLVAYGEPLARSAIDPALALTGAVGLSGLAPIWRWIRDRRRPRIHLPRLGKRSGAGRRRKMATQSNVFGETASPTTRGPRHRLRLTRPRLSRPRLRRRRKR